MNYLELKAALVEHYGEGDVDEFAFEEKGDIPGIGSFKEVEQEGGEGEGDHWHSVKYFPDHDIYIEVYGSYSSDNGVDFWDGWSMLFQVTPKEKTIIVYETVKN